MTAPTVRAWSALANGSSGTITIAKPTGTVDGDFMVVAMMNRANWATWSYSDFTGWTNLDQVNYGGTSTQADVSVWTRTASSEPSSWSLTGGNTDVAGVCVSFVGAAAVEHYAMHINNTTATSLTSNTLNPTLADTLLLLFDTCVSSGTAISSVTQPAGMSFQVHGQINAGNVYVSAFYEVLTANSSVTKTYSANQNGKNANFIMNLKTVGTDITVSPPAGTHTYAGLVPTVFIPQGNPPLGTYTMVGKVPTISTTASITVTPPAGTHTYVGKTASAHTTAILHQCLATADLVYTGQTSVTNHALVASPSANGEMVIPVSVGAVSSSFSFTYTFTGTTYGSTLVGTSDLIQCFVRTDSTGITVPGTNHTFFSPNASSPGAATGSLTYSGLIPGQSVHIQMFTSWRGSFNGGSDFGINIAPACLDQTIDTGTAADINLSAPVAATTTYLGYVATVTKGILATPPTGALTYTGFTPTFLINGEHIFIAPAAGTTTYVGLGPVILGTTASVVLQVIQSNVQYIGQPPNVRPLDPSELTFNFIDESYIGYTALDGTPLTEIQAGALFHGQQKIMRFRIGNTSQFVVDFDLSAHSLNLDLIDEVEFSLDNLNWSSTLHIPFILGNAVTEMIFMRLSVDALATIGVGTYLINVEKTYAQ